jgi:hypothetical protein
VCAGGTSAGAGALASSLSNLLISALGHALERSHHPHNIDTPPPLAPRRLPPRRPLTMITVHTTINSIRQNNQHNHVNGTRSESQVAGRTGSDTICNGLLVTTTILVTGANFFFFLRCVRACTSNNTLNGTTPLDNQRDATTKFSTRRLKAFNENCNKIRP